MMVANFRELRTDEVRRIPLLRLSEKVFGQLSKREFGRQAEHEIGQKGNFLGSRRTTPRAPQRLFGQSLSHFSETTNLTQEQIELATGNEQTKLPDHLKPPASWSQSSHDQQTRDK
jgi:hypothetical protein